jgi:hypothetical protein
MAGVVTTMAEAESTNIRSNTSIASADPGW